MYCTVYSVFVPSWGPLRGALRSRLELGSSCQQIVVESWYTLILPSDLSLKMVKVYLGFSKTMYGLSYGGSKGGRCLSSVQLNRDCLHKF